jgi:hypothetical protein
MILYGFCCLPDKFCYIVINVWYFESLMQFMDWCAPWEVTNDAENLVLEDAAISLDGYLPQIPRQGKHESLQT